MDLGLFYRDNKFMKTKLFSFSVLITIVVTVSIKCVRLFQDELPGQAHKKSPWLYKARDLIEIF